MKKLMIIMATLVLGTAAHAQSVKELKEEGGNNVKLLVGSSQAATNFGLSYERRSGTFGVGAMVLQSTKNAEVNKPESTTVGAFVASHLYDNNDLDVYISPGIAVTNMDSITSPGDDETLVGPTLAIGVLYTINNRWSAGLEYTTIYNWFSEKVGDEYNFTNAVLSYNF